MSDDPLSFGFESTAHATAFAAGGPLVWPLEPRVAAGVEKWLAVASDAQSVDTQLFAKLIAARDVRRELALLGLHRRDWEALVSRHFAHATAQGLPIALDGAIASTKPDGRTMAISGLTVVSDNPVVHAQDDFVHSLHALLLIHASPNVDLADARDLATIVVHACLRPDHLWRDLGLAGRKEVTWMLTRYFPTLVALNVANLRWKKFLAGQRALSLGLPPAPAPGCPGCEDYGHCFPASREKR